MWLCCSDCTRGDRDKSENSVTIWAFPDFGCHSVFNRFLFDTYLAVNDLSPCRVETHLMLPNWRLSTGGRRAVRGWSVPFRFSGNPEGCIYWYKVLLALSRKLILCFLFPNLQLCVVKTSLVLWTMYRPCPVSCEMSWVSVHTISLQHGTSW